MPTNHRNTPEVPDLKPLFMILAGAFFGFGAVPDDSSWIIGVLGGLVGAALFFAVGIYIQRGVQSGTRSAPHDVGLRAKDWNPYANNWQAITMGAAVVMPFLVAGIIVSLLVEATTAMKGSWLVTFFATLGLATAGLYLGHALRAGERTPPGAFIRFSYLLFSLTFAGFIVAGLAFSGQLGNEVALAAGSLIGAAIAFIVWVILLMNRGVG